MTFAEIVLSDVDIFLELEEFAEEIELSGVKMRAQVIAHTGKTDWDNIAQKHEELYVHTDKHGIRLIGDYATVYFKASDYVAARERIPRATEYVHLNGKRYKVVEARESKGLVKLEISSDRMNQPRPEMARLQGLYE